MSEPTVPSYDKFLLPVMRSFINLGNRAHVHQIRDEVALLMINSGDITREGVEYSRPGKDRPYVPFNMRLSRAMDMLRETNYLGNPDPGKGFWNTTPKGQEILKDLQKGKVSGPKLILDERRNLPNSIPMEQLDKDEENTSVTDAIVQDSPVWPVHKYDADTKNVILYGPPGTGKTFRTTARAVKLARGNVSEDTNNASDANNAALRAEYKRLVAAGQIVFVTFHQSYGYEEFVEGIRPETTDDGQVSYDVRWGALRRIADAAQRALVVMQRRESLWEATRRVAGEKLFDWLSEGEESLTATYKPSASLPAVARKATLEAAEGELSGFDQLVEGGDDTTRGMLTKLLREAHEARRATPTAQINWDATPQYVMIIDEINRGNMSRIFGELITLLEPSKRLGASDELIVRLPASGDDFGLPPNLHFIGTMNTADRSIALLDVALRRRFRFEELMPDPELVKDSPNGARLMTALNKRIAILLDREHQLGHALFMRAKDDAGLVGVLQKDVLPLLKEYFYGDWERIAAVLMCSGADKSKDDKTTNGALVYKETINDHELPKGLVEQGAASMWCELSFEEAEKVAGAIIARVIGATK
jgi:hypothetical protein